MMTIDANLKKNNGDMRLYGPLSLQMLAAAFFALKPLTTLMKFVSPSDKDADRSMKWPNFFGVLFFHIANMISISYSLQSVSFSGPKSSSGYEGSSKQNVSFLFLVLATALMLSANGRIVEMTKISRKTQTGYAVVGDLLLVVGYGLYAFW